MGIRDLINIKPKKIDSGCDKKKPNMLIVWIIIGAVIYLAVGGFPKDNDKKENSEEKVDITAYEKEQEERLARILKKINGAGDVTVYIKLDDGGEAVTAKNEKSSIEGDNKDKKEEYETETVMSGKGSEPYVIKEKEPQISGILVVASGAANESVRVKIFDAVKAVCGVSPHRIQVTY